MNTSPGPTLSRFRLCLTVIVALVVAALPLAVTSQLLDPRTSQRFWMQCTFFIIAALAASVGCVRSKTFSLERADVFALLVAFATVLSALTSATPAASFGESLFLLSLATSWFLFRAVLSSHTGFLVTGAAFLAAGMVVTAAAIAQSRGLDILDYSQTEREGKLRIASTLGNPNYVASFLAPLILLSGALATRKAMTLRVAGTVSAMLFVIALVISGGRAGLGSFVIGLAVVAILAAIRYFKCDRQFGTRPIVITSVAMMLMLTGFVTALRLAGYDVVARIVEGGEVSLRLLPWHLAWDMFLQNPLTGTGPGRFFVESRDYLIPFLANPDNAIYLFEHARGRGGAASHLHNEFLQILVETGIIGLVSFALLLGTVLVSILRRTFNPSRTDWLSQAFLAGALFCMMSDAVFGFPFSLPASGLLFWYLMAASTTNQSEETILFQWNPPAAIRLVSGVLLTGFLVGGSYLSFRQAKAVALRVKVAAQPDMLRTSPRTVRELEKAWFAAPFLKPTSVTLTNFHLERGDDRKVDDLLHQVEKHDYLGGPGYQQWAVSVLRLGDRDRAVEYLRRARILDPQNPEIAEYHAYLLIQTKQLDQAMDALRDASRFDAIRPNAFYLEGIVYRERGNPAAAANAFKRAKRVLPLYVRNLLFDPQELEALYQEALIDSAPENVP